MGSRWTINGHKAANWSMHLIVFLTCLPLTMLLPSTIRYFFQILALLLFVASLLLLKQWSLMLSMLVLFSLSVLYYLGAWNERMGAGTFLFNSLCCWISVLYASMCMTGVLKCGKRLLWFIAAITAFTAITTILGLREYPLAVRELGRELSYSGADVKSLYRTKNIASWSQVYGMVFMIGGFCYWYKAVRDKRILILIALTMICIIRSQLTLGVLLSACLFFFVMMNTKKSRRFIVALSVILITAVLLFIWMDQLLQVLIGFFNGLGLQMFTNKLNDLHKLLVDGSSTGDAAARFDLYALSLKTFGKYPFGLILESGIKADGAVGFHSELSDILGTLGLIGLSAICVFSGIWVRMVKHMHCAYDVRYLIITFSFFLIVMILNPVFYSPQIWIGCFTLPVALVCTYSVCQNETSRSLKCRRMDLAKTE